MTPLIIAQATIEPALQQYGIAGVALGGAFFMMKYFMATLDKKDAQMNDFIKSTLDLQREFKVELVAALRELRDEIHRQREA